MFVFVRFFLFFFPSPYICVNIRTEAAGLLLTGRSRNVRAKVKSNLSSGQFVSVGSQGKGWKRGQTAWKARAAHAAAPFVCSSGLQLFINILMEVCLLLLLRLSSLNGAFYLQHGHEHHAPSSLVILREKIILVIPESVYLTA